MNIIIAGCGKVGRTLAEQLSKEGHEITVIDTNLKSIQDLTDRYDIIGYMGDCTSYHIQLEAGIKNADLLIAVTDQDEKNMLACLIARKAGKCQTIARVRSPQYSEEIRFIKDELGLSMSMNPEHAAALEMVRLMQIPSALEVDTFAKGRVSLVSLVIPEYSAADNMLVKDISTKLGVNGLICIVERGKQVIIPSGNFMLKANDKISVTISMADINQFLNKFGIKTKHIKNVLIAGGGTMTYYLAKQLIKMRIQVKIIEKNPERCEKLADLLPKAMIINGNATDKSLLMEESIDKMDAVCSLMDADEENILLSLYITKTTHAKVMTRIHRNSYEEVIDEMPLGNIISAKKITAEYITRYVRSMQNSFDSNVETLYRMVGDKVEALELNVGSDAKVTKAPLSDLKIAENTLICCINRKGKIIRPGGKDMIMVGDSVIVVTTKKGFNDIDDILDE